MSGANAFIATTKQYASLQDTLRAPSILSALGVSTTLLNRFDQ